MTQQTINVGAAPNDGTGDPARTAFTKCNANFTELYASSLGFASSADFPAGAWTAWSPTITSLSGTITTFTVNRAKYVQLGKTVIACLDVTINTAGTGASILQFTLPVTAVVAFGGTVQGIEVAVSGVALTGSLLTTTLGYVNVYNGATIILDGYRSVVTATYEAA